MVGEQTVVTRVLKISSETEVDGCFECGCHGLAVGSINRGICALLSTV